MRLTRCGTSPNTHKHGLAQRLCDPVLCCGGCARIIRLKLLIMVLRVLMVDAPRSSALIFQCMSLGPADSSMDFAMETWLEGLTTKLTPYGMPSRPRAARRAGVPRSTPGILWPTPDA